jgi:hypothetical protein
LCIIIPVPVVHRADRHAHIPLGIGLVLRVVVETMTAIAVRQSLGGRDDAERLALLLAFLLLLALPAAADITYRDAGTRCSCRGVAVAVAVAVWQTIGFRRSDGLSCGF